MESVTLYETYKECPECGCVNSKTYIENRKFHHFLDYYNVENSYLTVYRIDHFICGNRHCNHRWEEHDS